jgi:hypothetical protein
MMIIGLDPCHRMACCCAVSDCLPSNVPFVYRLGQLMNLKIYILLYSGLVYQHFLKYEFSKYLFRYQPRPDINSVVFSVNFSFLNNPHLVQEIFDAPERQFGMAVAETTDHVFPLLKISSMQPLCLFHMFLIILEISLILSIIICVCVCVRVRACMCGGSY